MTMTASASQQAYEHIREAFQKQHSVTIRPQGTSMFPFLIENRNLVTLEPWTAHKPHRGDIMLYQRENQLLILHRLWRIRKDGYYFVGDNQTAPEGPVSPSQLIAVVTEITKGKRCYSVKFLPYRFLSRLWLFLRPLRPYISRPAGKIFTCLQARRRQHHRSDTP